MNIEKLIKMVFLLIVCLWVSEVDQIFISCGMGAGTTGLLVTSPKGYHFGF